MKKPSFFVHEVSPTHWEYLKHQVSNLLLFICEIEQDFNGHYAVVIYDYFGETEVMIEETAETIDKAEIRANELFNETIKKHTI